MGEGGATSHAQNKLNAAIASLAFLLIFTGTISLMVVVNLKEDPPTPKVSWWKKSIIYHVYMPSFKDTDGDGYGDLAGVTQKLQHIKDIGASSLWLSPFFKFKPRNDTETSQTDLGYDVIDHTKVDPLFGTMEDFDTLSKKATELGLHLIIDFIPNHMNSESAEFNNSVFREDDKEDWFVWRNLSSPDLRNPQDHPPNEWKSQTGQSAWEWNKDREQFYLHNGLPSMPDLNLRNKQVKEHVNKILDFWLEKGVHGFRLGALNLLIEDEDNDDEANLIHSDIPATIELMEEWTAKLEEHEDDNLHRLLMVELVHDPDRVVDGDNHYQNFTYDVVDNPFGFHNLFGDDTNKPTGVSVAKAVKEYIDSIPEESWPNWVIHTHDMKGKEVISAKMKESLMIMAMTLPGTCINYYGDEIGMSRNGDISWEQTMDAYARDPYANEQNYEKISRDPSRTPMQWTAGNNSGFTDAENTPWLPVNSEFEEVNVESQKNANHSAYLTFTKLAELRNEVAFFYGDTFFPYQDESAFCFIRKSSTEHVAYLVAINFNTATDHAVVKIDFTSLFPEFPTSGVVVVSDSNNVNNHKPGEEILLEDFELYALEAIVIKIDFSDQDALNEE